MVVSPALAELLRSVPADQLGDRFPGRVTGTIGPEGLVSPDELVAIVGHTPEQMRAIVGAYEIRGFERPGEGVDLGFLVQILVAMLAVLLLGPLVVFIALVTRVGAARREQRFAGLRLAGATRWQTAVLAATETATAAIGGVLLGWLGYLVARPVVATYVRLEGLRFPLEDLAAPAAPGGGGARRGAADRRGHHPRGAAPGADHPAGRAPAGAAPAAAGDAARPDRRRDPRHRGRRPAPTWRRPSRTPKVRSCR